MDIAGETVAGQCLTFYALIKAAETGKVHAKEDTNDRTEWQAASVGNHMPNLPCAQHKDITALFQ